MLAGPIYRVELVSVSRRTRYYVMRVIYALILFFILWMSYSTMTSFGRVTGQPISIRQASHMATGFFISFSWVQLLGILLVAPAMAVGTIATERERRTIEYLFVSDLSNLEIVLGKTLARLTLIGKFLLVALPILFLFRMLGGIPADLLAGSFLIGGSTVLLVTAISVAVSVWSPKSRDAMIRVYLLMAVLFLLPLILLVFTQGALRNVAGSPWLNFVQDSLEAVISLNPIYVLGEAMGNRFAAGATFDFSPLLEMAGWHLAISLTCITLATWAVRRVHLGASSKGEKSDQSDGLSLFQTISRGWRPALGDRPMIWKEAFAGTAKTRFGWLGLITGTLIVLTIFGLTVYAFVESLGYQRSYSSKRDYFGFMAGLVGAVGSLLLISLSSRAAGSITQEKESDCWLSLLATPLTGSEILAGKVLGSFYAMRWGIVPLAFAWLLAAFLNPGYFAAAIPFMLTAIACASFAAMLGLYFSLRSKTTLQASASTIATLIVVGGGYMLCCCGVIGVTGGQGGEQLMTIALAPCMPYLLGFPSSFGLWWNEVGTGGDQFFRFVISYMLGTIGYGIASFVLWRSIVEQFERIAGRTHGRPKVGAHDGADLTIGRR
ncbi:MAG: ABC transporter permease [Lacipirellulaceae bacterium]